MIVFLTLTYVAFVALLVKFKIVKLTMFWKLSPALWVLLLFVVLFIPLQWGAPSGSVNVYQTVVEVIPNVSGEVIEVSADGLERIEKGGVLFKIDPRPFQIAVDRARSTLAEAEQNVKQLQATADSAAAVVEKTKQEADIFAAEQRIAGDTIVAADASVREQQAVKAKADSIVVDLQFQLDTAQKELNRMNRLVASSAVSQSEVDRTQIQFTGLERQRNTARIDAQAAIESITKSKANLDAAKTQLTAIDLRLKQLIEAEIPRVTFDAQQARLAAGARIDGKHTIVATAEAQLASALFDLEQTVVRAPANGYAIGVTLRPGQRVANFPVRSWMSFVNEEQPQIAMGVSQYAMRHVELGQKAEITFKLYPGRIFDATVERIASINAQGQLGPSGDVPDAPGSDVASIPYGVILKLDDNVDVDEAKLAGGSVGTAAIYTSRAKISHLLRRVMIRMQAWQNYVIP